MSVAKKAGRLAAAFTRALAEAEALALSCDDGPLSLAIIRARAAGPRGVAALGGLGRRLALRVRDAATVVVEHASSADSADPRDREMERDGREDFYRLAVALAAVAALVRPAPEPRPTNGDGEGTP
jgi:hypothetical protein